MGKTGGAVESRWMGRSATSVPDARRNVRGDVYDIYGYTAASLCVALGNYHNMDVKRGRIAPRNLSTSRIGKTLVKLFVQIGRARA